MVCIFLYRKLLFYSIKSQLWNRISVFVESWIEECWFIFAIAISNHCTTNIWIVSACRKRKTSRIQLQQRQQHDDDDDVSNAGSGFDGQSWNGRTFAVLAGKHAHPVLNARQRFGLRRRFRFQLHLQQQRQKRHLRQRHLRQHRWETPIGSRDSISWPSSVH